MNLKLFTGIVLFLCCVFSVNAQDMQASIEKNIDIDFIVSDSVNEQLFKLAPKSVYLLPQRTHFVFRIHLQHRSAVQNVRFFGIQYEISELLPNGMPGELIRGITAPVLIPPVRKKKDSVASGRTAFPEDYPFTIPEGIMLNGRTHCVEMNLAMYYSREDYFRNNLNFDSLPSVSFRINAATNPMHYDNLEVTTYPNPTRNHLTIDYVNTETQHPPLDIIIFDDQGTEINRYHLTNTSVHNNVVSYYLSTAHLANGTYFFKFTIGDQSCYKTILKQ